MQTFTIFFVSFNLFATSFSSLHFNIYILDGEVVRTSAAVKFSSEASFTDPCSSSLRTPGSLIVGVMWNVMLTKGGGADFI